MGKQHEYENEEQNYYSSGSGISNKLTYLLVGGGIGAVLALLFAPKSGTELRGDIADVTRKGYDKTRDAASQLGQKSGEYYESARQVAGDVYSRAGDAYSAARSQFSKSAEQAGEAVHRIGEQAGVGGQNAGNQNAGGKQAGENKGSQGNESVGGNSGRSDIS